MNRPELEPYIIVEGGLVQNDPALPVFDLDGLVDQDVEWIQNLYERMLKLIADEYADTNGRFIPKNLPGTLRYALERAEKTVIELTGTDHELIALARTDAELLSELFGYADSTEYGERTAQVLAARVLGLIGIAVPDGQTIILTDVDPEPGTSQVNLSQLQYAVEQYNLANGENLNADALEEAIGWL